jgi:hypothetical protein
VGQFFGLLTFFLEYTGELRIIGLLTDWWVEKIFYMILIVAGSNDVQYQVTSVSNDDGDGRPNMLNHY